MLPRSVSSMAQQSRCTVSQPAALCARSAPVASCTPPSTSAACPLGQPQRQTPGRSPFRTEAAGGNSAGGTASGSGLVKHAMQQAQGRQARPTPWYIGFQTNERTLEWEEGATIQLLKMHVAQKSGQDLEWVNARLKELVVLLPDIVAKLGRVKADLILQLCDTQMVAERLVALEAILPGVDLSRLTARYPALLLDHTPNDIAATLDRLRHALPPGTAVERLVEAEPVLLEVDIQLVLAEIRRLLPGQDEARVLLRDPSMVLDMKAYKMGSSLQDTQ